MKKRVVLLSLIAIFVACGKKEEVSKVEVVAPAIVKQVGEEKKVAPIVAEEIVTEEVGVVENKTSEVIENIEESAVVDVVETTSGEIVGEAPVTEEEVAVKEAPADESLIVTTTEKK